MKRPTFLAFGMALAAVVCTSLTPVNAASDAGKWPSQQVTWIIGYAPGGTTDIIARVLASALTQKTGHAFVVENRAGANSNIGAEFVKRAAPDGYTFFVGSTANAINRTLYANIGYDIAADYQSVALLGTVPNLLVVNPKLPVRNVKEYIAYAKEHPGKLTCASSGTGSAIHMSCELFKIQTGTQILHVPYRGSGPAMAGLMGGQVDSIFDNMPTELPNVRAGKLRALGVTTAERSPFAPDIPTLAESGLPNFSVESWFGLFAPKATDPAIVSKMNQAVNLILADPKVQGVFTQSGITMPRAPNSPPAFASFVKNEEVRWADVVKRSGAHVD
jgi:tripartite-type tricarboxylate transporter receptor subunit TctC